MYAEDYVENDVISNDPVELVCLLYSKAIERLHQAKARFEADDPTAAAESIARAMEIVLELIGSLDMDKGGDIAANLATLYLYVQEQLAEATTQQSSECLANAERVLAPLLEGWKECQSKLLVEDVAGHVRPEVTTAAVSGGRAWTL